MSDDLVKRMLNEDGKDLSEVELHALCIEAADRIEKLEALLDEDAFSQTLFDAVVNQRNRANARIEQLEAALRELSTDWPCCDVSKAMREIARKALEGKDE